MKPERTLQKMYDEYPKLFPTRQQALDHLFCVIGNGYSWHKGEIVADDELFILDDELEKLIDSIPDDKKDELQSKTDNIKSSINNMKDAASAESGE